MTCKDLECSFQYYLSTSHPFELCIMITCTERSQSNLLVSLSFGCSRKLETKEIGQAAPIGREDKLFAANQDPIL